MHLNTTSIFTIFIFLYLARATLNTVVRPGQSGGASTSRGGVGVGVRSNGERSFVVNIWIEPYHTSAAKIQCVGSIIHVGLVISRLGCVDKGGPIFVVDKKTGDIPVKLPVVRYIKNRRRENREIGRRINYQYDVGLLVLTRPAPAESVISLCLCRNLVNTVMGATLIGANREGVLAETTLVKIDRPNDQIHNRNNLFKALYEVPFRALEKSMPLVPPEQFEGGPVIVEGNEKTTGSKSGVCLYAVYKREEKSEKIKEDVTWAEEVCNYNDLIQYGIKAIGAPKGTMPGLQGPPEPNEPPPVVSGPSNPKQARFSGASVPNLPPQSMAGPSLLHTGRLSGASIPNVLPPRFSGPSNSQTVRRPGAKTNLFRPWEARK